MDIQELRTMGSGNCVLLDMKEVRGAGYFSKLYELSDHPRYNFLYEPWNQEDEENRKREYQHGFVLLEEKKERELEEFYKKFGIDPEKVIIRKQERLINGDSISWSPSIISPEQFMNKFDIN